MRTMEERIMADARSGHPCIRCGCPGKDLEGHQQVYGRHYNGIRQHALGKGRGIKGHCFAVPDFCDKCDKDFQEGSISKDDWQARIEYSEEFLFWCLMSLIRRAKNEVIR